MARSLHADVEARAESKVACSLVGVPPPPRALDCDALNVQGLVSEWCMESQRRDELGAPSGSLSFWIIACLLVPVCSCVSELSLRRLGATLGPPWGHVAYLGGQRHLGAVLERLCFLVYQGHLGPILEQCCLFRSPRPSWGCLGAMQLVCGHIAAILEPCFCFWIVLP